MAAPVTNQGRFILRYRIAAVLAALVATLVAAAPASAATPGGYTYTVSSGSTFQLLSTGQILPPLTVSDDTITTLSTTAAKPFRLPFPLVLYGQQYSSVNVSTNGNLQVGTANAVFTNEALPDTGDFSTSGTSIALFPWFDDLYFDPTDTSHFFREGIFTHTSGTAPHKKFVISWQGHGYNNESYIVLAQAIFKQGQGTFTFRYGSSDNQAAGAPSETIGIQYLNPLISPHYRQVTFDPPPPGEVQQGTQIVFTHH